MGNEVAVGTRNEVARILTTLQPKMALGLGYVNPARLGLRANELKIQHSKKSRNDPWEPGDLKLGKDVFPGAEGFDFRILVVHEFREYRVGKERESRVVCASNTMEAPLETVDEPRSASCFACPYSQWSDGLRGKRVPPPCSPGWAILGIREAKIEGEKVLQPFWFISRKSANKTTEGLVKSLANNNALDALVQPLIRITTKEESQGQGGLIYYTPVFTILTGQDELPTREDIPVIWGLSQEIMERQLRFVPRVTGVVTATGGTGDDEGDGAEEDSGIPSGGKPASTDIPDEIPFG